MTNFAISVQGLTAEIRFFFLFDRSKKFAIYFARSFEAFREFFAHLIVEISDFFFQWRNDEILKIFPRFVDEIQDFFPAILRRHSRFMLLDRFTNFILLWRIFFSWPIDEISNFFQQLIGEIRFFFPDHLTKFTIFFPANFWRNSQFYFSRSFRDCFVQPIDKICYFFKRKIGENLSSRSFPWFCFPQQAWQNSWFLFSTTGTKNKYFIRTLQPIFKSKARCKHL